MAGGTARPVFNVVAPAITPIAPAEPITPCVFAPDLHPWERQYGETDAAWDAFLTFREMGPKRSLRKAYLANTGNDPEKVPCAPRTTWGMWSTQWRWSDRVEEYDRYQDTIFRKQLEARRLEARVETADLGQHMRTKALEALSVMRTIINQQVRQKDGTVITVQKCALTPTEIARLAEIGVKLERLALGEETTRPGSLVGVAVQVNIGDDELIARAQSVIAAREGDTTTIIDA